LSDKPNRPWHPTRLSKAGLETTLTSKWNDAGNPDRCVGDSSVQGLGLGELINELALRGTTRTRPAK
jgi:hypothetical protein